MAAASTFSNPTTTKNATTESHPGPDNHHQDNEEADETGGLAEWLALSEQIATALDPKVRTRASHERERDVQRERDRQAFHAMFYFTLLHLDSHFLFLLIPIFTYSPWYGNIGRRAVVPMDARGPRYDARLSRPMCFRTLAHRPSWCNRATRKLPPPCSGKLDKLLHQQSNKAMYGCK